ncbi:tripartite tricarboxylate transporter substrate binding protein [Pigmentiphaga sp. H8]|uniref:Bug family tripartite tricarboxylate transporter substrate binding protein n=1 Tax=Pigmentiphaga sp. H8 TaxID=2488560 RepID=UPI000F5B7164|nr:tripartite tricarboxylate transporter substrate binding protein [Pigmentiphaga sp. H8]AZG08228.1 tripartite tricarboxylate transporter substrate binding protein [Pigmentiphaga sp. H8]
MRSSLVLGIAALAATFSVAAAPPSLPRQINLVVGFAAGGNTDMAARILANAMKQSLPIPIVVENRAGAGGTVGGAHVAKSPPDGSTLLVGSQSETTMLKANRAKPPYDIDKDFAPIAKIMDQDYVVVVPRSLGISTWEQFVALAKSRGSISYATSGIGTTAHIMSEHLATAMGVKAVHVPYQGASAFRADLIAGRVDFAIDVIPLSLPLIADGKLRALAVTQARRDDRLPNAPSLVQLGLFAEPYAGWTGVFAPRETPPETRTAILEQVNRMLAGSGGEEIRKAGYRPASSHQAAEDFARFVASDQKRWIEIFQKIGVPPSP